MLLLVQRRMHLQPITISGQVTQGQTGRLYVMAALKRAFRHVKKMELALRDNFPSSLWYGNSLTAATSTELEAISVG
jgi:hypothetical protein